MSGRPLLVLSNQYKAMTIEQWSLLFASAFVSCPFGFCMKARMGRSKVLTSMILRVAE